MSSRENTKEKHQTLGERMQEQGLMGTLTGSVKLEDMSEERRKSYLELKAKIKSKQSNNKEPKIDFKRDKKTGDVWIYEDGKKMRSMHDMSKKSYILNKRFARNFQAMRITAGITQKDFAKILNMDRSFFSHIETGRRCANLKTVDKVAAVFEIDPALLLQEKLPKKAISAAKAFSKEIEKKK